MSSSAAVVQRTASIRAAATAKDAEYKDWWIIGMWSVMMLHILRHRGDSVVLYNMFTTHVSNFISAWSQSRSTSTHKYLCPMHYVFIAHLHAKLCRARYWYWNSVCPSVTVRYCVKTAKHIIDILSSPGSPIILVFRPKRIYKIPTW